MFAALLLLITIEQFTVAFLFFYPYIMRTLTVYSASSPPMPRRVLKHTVSQEWLFY